MFRASGALSAPDDANRKRPRDLGSSDSTAILPLKEFKVVEMVRCGAKLVRVGSFGRIGSLGAAVALCRNRGPKRPRKTVADCIAVSMRRIWRKMTELERGPPREKVSAAPTAAHIVLGSWIVFCCEGVTERIQKQSVNHSLLTRPCAYSFRFESSHVAVQGDPSSCLSSGFGHFSSACFTLGYEETQLYTAK